jgi:hypothetical protein
MGRIGQGDAIVTKQELVRDMSETPASDGPVLDILVPQKSAFNALKQVMSTRCYLV